MNSDLKDMMASSSATATRKSSLGDSDTGTVFSIQRLQCGASKKQLPFILEGHEVLIGRHNDAQVLIRSEEVSRQHAILKKTSAFWEIQDLKSTNGVWINKTQLMPLISTRLSPGDVISLGTPQETKFRYLFQIHSSESQRSNSPPCKVFKNDPEQQKLKMEMEEKVKNLEQQLEEKEKQLKEQLEFQQREYHESLEQEKARILAEKEASERELKRQLQDRIEAQEKSLRDSIQAHRQALLAEKERVEQELRQKLTEEMQESLRKEQHILNQKLESSALKAQLLEKELAQSQHLQDQKKEEILHNFGDLMETEFTCSICSELFIQAQTLGCSHTFCLLCISQWKRKKKDCPICRTKIKSEARALNMDNFIEKMVENLSPSMKLSRQQLLRERGIPTLVNQNSAGPVVTNGTNVTINIPAASTSRPLLPGGQQTIQQTFDRTRPQVVPQIVTNLPTFLRQVYPAGTTVHALQMTNIRAHQRIQLVNQGPSTTSTSNAARTHGITNATQRMPITRALVPVTVPLNHIRPALHVARTIGSRPAAPVAQQVPQPLLPRPQAARGRRRPPARGNPAPSSGGNSNTVQNVAGTAVQRNANPQSILQASNTQRFVYYTFT